MIHNDIYIVALTAADVWSEYFGKYQGDKEPTDDWIKSRVYKFFGVMEAQLKQNKEGKGFYFDDAPSIADVFVYDMLMRFRLIKPDLYKECGFELLKGFVTRFEELPAIKAYLVSDRYKATIGKATTGKMGFLAL